MNKHISRMLVLALAFFAAASGAQPGSTPTAEEALKRLVAGNSRFVAGKPEHPNQNADRRIAVSTGQNPFVTVLSCADSRVPVEMLFDQGIGDTFVVRVAGNVADTDEIGTIEYGVGHLNTPLLVVLGHTSCGAVKAVVEGAKVHGSIPELVDNIVPAAEKAKAANPEAKGAALVGAAVNANVWVSIDDLFKRSPEVRELVSGGKLKVVGAVYHLDTGEVEWLGSHKEQARLLGYRGGDAHDEHGSAHAGESSHPESGNTAHGAGLANGTHANAGHGPAVAAHPSSSRTAIITSVCAATAMGLLAFGTFRWTRQRPLQVRILANSAVLLVMLLGMGVFVYAEFHKIGGELKATANDDLPILITLSDAETKVVKQALYLEKFGMTKNAQFASEFHRLAGEIDQELSTAETELKQAIEHAIHPEQREAYEKLLAEVKTLETQHREFDTDGDVLVAALKAGERARAAEIARKVAAEEAQMISEFTNIVAGIKSETLRAAQLSTSLESSGQTMVVAVSLCSLMIGLLFAWFTARSVSSALRSMANSLSDGASQTACAAGQVSSSAQSLAEGASEQAASLEETSASIEELSSITKRNAENAKRANDLARQTRVAADAAAQDMNAMNEAMEAIKESSDDIAKIIKTIDAIAFQTNILALNAAVEAARAGEAGMGFAVVADEVRGLAQRCAESAKETSAKIQGAITRTGQGVELSGKVATGLQEILSKARQMDQLAAEVASASGEQSTGISQVSNAVRQMDKVTQNNAASAEESAGAAEEMNAQAEALKEVVTQLLQLTGAVGSGTTGAPAHNAPRTASASKPQIALRKDPQQSTVHGRDGSGTQSREREVAMR